MPKIISKRMDSNIEKKLDYLGLDLNYIPKELKEYSDTNFRTIKDYEEKKYKQYKYVNISDIEILISSTTRADSIKEKYENAIPLCFYLDNSNEENIVYHTKFLEMLSKLDIAQIEKIEKEQKRLQKEIPFKIKYEGNYLWQIYYDEIANKYFMIVSLGDSDYSAFFYMLKKKIESKYGEKVFVPISLVDYSGIILKKQEIKDLENYLWLFTKDYPLIYEVENKDEEISLEIVGETQIFEKIKTLYKVSLKNKKEAIRFYKLIKALFILQTELPHYFEFKTRLNKSGSLDFYFEDNQIEYENISSFITEQYAKSVDLKNQYSSEIEELSVKLKMLKNESKDLEKEYAQKEKQITLFLECKKSFFGKVKYFFKLGKVSPPLKTRARTILDEKLEYKPQSKEHFQKENKKYTIHDLEQSFKELEKLEEDAKKIVMDINALKLKNKNLKKKIQNATNYIEEINKHKKSIFEFWRYSNKDAVDRLEEGEEEELNVTKIEKIFDFEEEFEKFGIEVDKNQRSKFTDGELEGSFIATTSILDMLNGLYKKTIENKEIAEKLKELKEEKESNYRKQNVEAEEFNIFGKTSQEEGKERTIGNKVHRESPRDKYEILEINKETKGIEFKKNLEKVLKNIKKALLKNELKVDTYVYKATAEKLKLNELETVSLNSEAELESFLNKNTDLNRFYLYKIKLPKSTNYIGFSNVIFYDNKNMTLPVGMNLSSKILVDFSKLRKSKTDVKIFNKLQFEDEKNDFSKIVIKSIKVEDVNTTK